MGNEFPGNLLGPQYAGYTFKITGGNDKDGFTMRQGILKAGRVRILMMKGHKCYRPRREGERRRKSVRGCIIGKDLSVIALSIVKQGETPIDKITNVKRARKLGPKRVSHIRKLCTLKKEDDPRKYVVRRPTKNNKHKSPKIQRLVTDVRRRRRTVQEKIKKDRLEVAKQTMADYKKVLEKRREKRDKKVAEAKTAKKAATAEPIKEKK